MTALERALVVYAEAKGYEVEVFDEGHQDWEPKLSKEYFNFNFNYRIKTRGDFHKASESLFQCFTGKKTIPEMMENIKKYKPAGFSCKTKMYTREEIEEMNKPKEEEFDVKAYVKSLVETPEYLERCKEVNPIIEILEAYKNGENNFEIQSKTSTDEGWKPLEDKPSWNFGYVNYRISPKQPEAIPATEEELEEVKSEPKPCFWIKDKKTGITWKLTEMGIGVMQDFYIFDKQTKTWQDWGSK